MRPVIFGTMFRFYPVGKGAPVAGGNAKAILLNTVPQKSRGSLFGIYTIMDDLGKGLGPALVASWVRAMGRTDAFKCLGSNALRWWIHLFQTWEDVLLRTRTNIRVSELEYLEACS